MLLPEGATSLTTRYYYEREKSINNERLHAIPIDIENIDPVAPRRSPADASLAAGIRRLTAFVRGNVLTMNAENSPAWVSREPNRFVPPVIDDSNKAVGYAAVGP